MSSPAGSFGTHFGKQIHHDGTKDLEAVLEIVGQGPATATPAGVKQRRCFFLSISDGGLLA